VLTLRTSFLGRLNRVTCFLPHFRSFLRTVALVAAFLACGSCEAAESSRAGLPPALSNAEARLIEAVQRGESLDLIDAALIASGVTESAPRERWLRVRDARYAVMDLPAIARLPANHRPAAILAGLHREILAGKFHPSATLLQDTLATGNYNCVTATILYHDLCARCDVPAEIVAQSGHVHSRLPGPPSEEIETTRRDWFTREAEPPPAAAKIKSASITVCRVISPTQLLGRVYYNRALAALERQQFAPAIDLLHLSLALDAHDRDARENLLAGFNNWALALSEAGDHAAAAEKITAGLAFDGNYQPLRVNELHVHQQWVAALCQRADYAGAVALLETGRTRRPEAPLFTAGQKPVFEAWLRDCTARGDAATAAQVLEQARQRLGTNVSFTLEARPTQRPSTTGPSAAGMK
jgi:hypothetical protein